jgi:hypothetical protein
MLCLSYYAYVFSSRKLEIRAEQVLPGSEVGWVGRGENDPNNVYTCEEMSNNYKKKNKR